MSLGSSVSSRAMERKAKMNHRMGAALLVHVTADPTQPTRIEVEPNGVLHITLQRRIASPEELDNALIHFLAHELSLSAEHIEVVAGNQRGKIVAFYEISDVELEDRLMRCCGLEFPPRLW